METRTIQQIKIYKLILNNMTNCKVEIGQIAAISYDKKILEDILINEAETWQDENWYKSYKKYSILEWYNPPCEHYGHGIIEEWVNEDILNNIITDNAYTFLNFSCLYYFREKKSN